MFTPVVLRSGFSDLDGAVLICLSYCMKVRVTWKENLSHSAAQMFYCGGLSVVFEYIFVINFHTLYLMCLMVLCSLIG